MTGGWQSARGRVEGFPLGSLERRKRGDVDSTQRVTFGGATATTGVTPPGLAHQDECAHCDKPTDAQLPRADQSAADLLEGIANAAADDFASTSSERYAQVEPPCSALEIGPPPSHDVTRSTLTDAVVRPGPPPCAAAPEALQ